MHDIVTQRLNQFLVEKNITYKELSGMILMSETSLCRKLTGSRSLDLHTLISIVACLPDVSSEWLLRGKGRVCNSSSSISSDVLVEELKMENNLLKRKIQVLQELLEFKMEKIRTENGNINLVNKLSFNPFATTRERSFKLIIV